MLHHQSCRPQSRLQAGSMPNFASEIVISPTKRKCASTPTELYGKPSLPHWLNSDGSLKTGVAYWVYENYLQWLRGDHNAHVMLRSNLLSLEAFREFKAFKAEERRIHQSQEFNHKQILDCLPAHMRSPAPIYDIPKNINPRAYRLQLKREIPNV